MEQLAKIAIVTDRAKRRELASGEKRERDTVKRAVEKLKEKMLPKKASFQSFPWKSLSVRNLLIGACAVIILLAAYLNLRFVQDKDDLPLTDDVVTEGAGTAADAKEDYFAVAVINRTRVRDEAIDMYQAMADDEAASATSRDQAYASMNALVDRTAAEVDIENRIKAKGFENCVAILEEDRANIIVQAQELTDAQVAQITEIVYLEAGVIPQNLTITEKV